MNLSIIFVNSFAYFSKFITWSSLTINPSINPWPNMSLSNNLWISTKLIPLKSSGSDNKLFPDLNSKIIAQISLISFKLIILQNNSSIFKIASKCKINFTLIKNKKWLQTWITPKILSNLLSCPITMISPSL